MANSFKKQIPEKAIKTFINTSKDNFGNIIEYTFLKQEGITETYLVNFEHGKQTLQLALNTENKILGILFKPYEIENTVGKFDRNSTEFILPFKGTWYTYWGGITKADNYHVTYSSQKGAFDFIIQNNKGYSYTRSGTRNEDYFAFGKPIYSVCDALVVKVTKGVRDNKPGEMNPQQTFGNSIVLKTKEGEYIVYAHFEEGTLQLKKGQQVTKGQYLANCGNSGNSSEPHLHFHIQDSANLLQSVGARSYFKNIIVNGTLQQEYTPVKGDIISRQE